MGQPYKGSFLQWRWETLAEVLSSIVRLLPIFRRFFQPEHFGKLEDKNLLAEVTLLSTDLEFLAWCEQLHQAVQLAEVARKWGTGCCCHAMCDATACDMKSRRLHEAPERFDSFCEDLARHRDSLSLLSCRGFATVERVVFAFCNSLLAGARLKFAWLRKAPYTFANMSNKIVTQSILQETQGVPPERSHRVTRATLEELGEDLQAVATGGAPGPSSWRKRPGSA